MPHVVLSGRIDLQAWARGFDPLVVQRGGDVLRTDRIYLERDARSALVEALVVEAGRKVPFYILVSAHDRGTCTVRIDPMTHPDRSPGVRELVARVADALLSATPGASIVRSNLVLPSQAPTTKQV